MRIKDDKNKFDDLFEGSEVSAFLYENEVLPISQFKDHFKLTNSRVFPFFLFSNKLKWIL